MKKTRSIPRELIEDKAHKIWQKRDLEGRDGTAESDWNEAKEYLEKHRGEVFLWKLGKVLNKSGKLIGRKVRVSLGFLWKLLTFPFLLLWRILTLPVWVFKTLHGLFADSDSRAFALDIVKTFISAFGLVATIFAGVGLFLNYQGAKEDRKLTQEQLGTAQERLITERFSKAVEQLGKNKDTTVRIGGIYALERIAKDSPKDHWTIMEVLTSYVRENSSLPPESKQIPQNEQEREQRQKELEKLPGVSIDVQAILTVIRRREDPDRDRDETIDLSFTNLKEANLDGADLSGANLDGANLSGADLFGADLSGADLDWADLSGADLFGADLNGSSLNGADLRGANLDGSNLNGSSLNGADLIRADLDGSSLSDAYLIEADLIRADLDGANLSEAYLSGANLSEANLSEAYLSEAYLSGANLRGANLSEADLFGAVLIRAYLSGADLFGADLETANLIEARNLTPTQIKSACNWSKAIYKEDESENLKYIKQLKQDKGSDPKEIPNC